MANSLNASIEHNFFTRMWKKTRDFPGEWKYNFTFFNRDSYVHFEDHLVLQLPLCSEATIRILLRCYLLNQANGCVFIFLSHSLLVWFKNNDTHVIRQGLFKCLLSYLIYCKIFSSSPLQDPIRASSCFGLEKIM